MNPVLVWTVLVLLILMSHVQYSGFVEEFMMEAVDLLVLLEGCGV